MKFEQVGIRRLAKAASLLAYLLPACASATTFHLGRDQGFSFNQRAAATVTEGEFTMYLAPATPGALLSQVSSSGIGINSQSVVGTDDPGFAVFNLIGGSGPLAGTGEYVEFWFDQPGILTGLDFDGVKDELLEYFLLESTGGLKIYFFDSSANMPDVPHPIYDRPLDAAISDGVLSGEVVLLWEDNVYDDEVYGLHIPFAAGQQFTLTFGAIGPPYGQGAANGARLQRITIVAVPEPATWWLVAAGSLALTIRRLRAK